MAWNPTAFNSCNGLTPFGWGYGYEYPYVNAIQWNDDWMLHKICELNQKVDMIPELIEKYYEENIVPRMIDAKYNESEERIYIVRGLINNVGS